MSRDDFAERIIRLKKQCLVCWAIEFSDIFPQSLNRKIADDELRRYGNPTSCKCPGGPKGERD